MAANDETKMFDRRTYQRYIGRGNITEKDYEKHLKGLPDVEAKADYISLEQPTALGTPTR